MHAPRSFLQVYNVHRYYDQVPQADTPPMPTGSLMREIAGMQMQQMQRVASDGSASSPMVSKGKETSLSVLPASLHTHYRSDMEEDGPPQKALHVRHATLGVRRRTLPRLPSGLEEDEPLGRFAWVESSWFQGLSGFVIFLNAIIIGLETDITTAIWWYVEQSLLIFFVLELTFRLLRHGCNFFRHEEDWVWNVFDFSIVMSGVFDQWLMSLLKRVTSMNNKGHKLGMVFMLMRMGRLLRIVRLFRLVRIVRPLFELAQGVLEALQGMFWVLVFMVMTLYAAAIVCTRLIGHGDALSEELLADDTVKQIQTMFFCVQESMFTLFGTVSSWSLKKFQPLFDDMPMLRPFFVLFYVYTSWALLAVMTGVVSENMIAIREQMLHEDKQKEELRKAKVTEMLSNIFKQGDVDNDGTVSRDEFELMMKNPDLVKKLKANVQMRPQDLQDLYDWLDRGGEGVIAIEAFMSGFKWVNEPLRAKTLVKLQERLNRDLKELVKVVTQTVERRVTEVQQLVVQPLRKIHAVTEQMQSLDVQFSELRHGLKDCAHRLPTLQEVQQVESRLSARIAAVADKLGELERVLQNE